MGPQVTEPPREGVPEDQAGLDLPAAGPASTSAPAHPQHVRPGAAWVGGMGAGVSAPLGLRGALRGANRFQVLPTLS